MADVRKGVKLFSPTAIEHGGHDRLLVARFAVDDAYPSEVAEARELIAHCAECAALADDIRVLRISTARVGAPRRPRDFRLTTERAESLRGSLVERVLRRLSAPGLAPLRPIAGVALSVGLVLAVVGAALPTPVAEEMRLMNEPDAAEQFPAAAPGDADGGVPADGGPGGEVPGEGIATPAAAPPDGEAAAEDAQRPESRDEMLEMAQPDDPLRSILFYGGLGIAVLSLGVLVLVIVARRSTDPLLR